MGKINFGYPTGKTLTFGVYSPVDVEREVGTSLPETPAGSGRYIANSSTVLLGDDVIVKKGSDVVGSGEYEVELSEITPAGYVGDYKKKDIVYFLWQTKSTPSVDGTIKVYKNDGTGEITAGIEDTRNFDGLSNVHLCRITLSADNAYAIKRDYSVVLSGATIGGQSVDMPIASFSIENRYQGIDFKRDV